MAHSLHIGLVKHESKRQFVNAWQITPLTSQLMNKFKDWNRTKSGMNTPLAAQERAGTSLSGNPN